MKISWSWKKSFVSFSCSWVCVYLPVQRVTNVNHRLIRVEWPISDQSSTFQARICYIQSAYIVCRVTSSYTLQIFQHGVGKGVLVCTINVVVSLCDVLGVIWVQYLLFSNHCQTIFPSPHLTCIEFTFSIIWLQILALSGASSIVWLRRESK